MLFMSLTGAQLQIIQEALLDAYSSPKELQMMVRHHLDENLYAIAGGENLRVLAFNLVSWAEQYGRIEDLIQGAYQGNPNNPAVRMLQTEAQNWFDGAERAGIAPIVYQEPTGPVAIDIFLCFSHYDIVTARHVQELLRKEKISVWLYEVLEPGSGDWQEAIEAAIVQAKAMVVLLSPNAKTSYWVKNETIVALRHKKRIFPVLIVGDETDSVPLGLNTIQWVDGRANLTAAFREKLLPLLFSCLGRETGRMRADSEASPVWNAPGAAASVAASLPPTLPTELLPASEVVKDGQARPESLPAGEAQVKPPPKPAHSEAERLFLLGESLYAQKDYSQAVAEFTQAIALTPYDARYLFARSLCYYEQKQFAPAMTDVSKALKLQPDEPRYYYARGALYYELAEYRRAVADFSKAIELKPTNGSYHARGLSHVELRQHEHAVEDFSKALAFAPNHAGYAFLRGQCYYKLKQYTQAIADFSAAIAIDPINAGYYHERGRSYHALQDYDRAIADFYEAIELEPDNAVFYSSRGESYCQRSDYALSISDQSRAIELAPKKPAYYYRRGICHYRASDYTKAIADFTSALNLNPQSSNYYYARSLSYYAQKSYPDAIGGASAAIKQQEKAEYFNLRGLSNHAYAKTGHLPQRDRGWGMNLKSREDYYDDAIKDFSRAIELDPDNATYYANRSLTYEALGDKHKAGEDQRMVRWLAK